MSRIGWTLALLVPGWLLLRAGLHLALLRGLRAPRLSHASLPADWGVPAAQVHQVWLPGPRGRRLFAWYLTPEHAGTAAALVMHGWGANAALMLPAVPALHAAGLAVLLLDARCHGRSDDDDFSSMPRFAEDIAVGLDWLRARPGVDAKRLSLVGHSVGAAAALLHASGDDRVRAVVSLSAFADPAELMQRWLAERGWAWRLITTWVLGHVQQVIGARFSDIAPLNTLPQVRCPVLLVHGEQDTTVPVSDARRLAAAAPQAQLWVLPGSHDLGPSLVPHAPVLADFLQAASCRLPTDTCAP